MNLFRADATRLRAGFKQPGAGNAGHEFAEMIVIEDVNEFGNEDAGFASAGTHGQFVGKVANGGEPHAGNAEMFAEGGDVFHMEFVERDDAVGGVAYGSLTDRMRHA